MKSYGHAVVHRNRRRLRSSCHTELRASYAVPETNRVLIKPYVGVVCIYTKQVYRVRLRAARWRLILRRYIRFSGGRIQLKRQKCLLKISPRQCSHPSTF